MAMHREQYVTRDPQEIFAKWWPLVAVGALQSALLGPAIMGWSWWMAPWIFLGSLVLFRVNTLRCFATYYGPVVTLDERGITADQGFLGGQWTLPWREYAGYRDEEPGPENRGCWLGMSGGLGGSWMRENVRVLTILSRRGVYGRLPISFAYEASRENYQRLLEALDRYAPR